MKNNKLNKHNFHTRNNFIYILARYLSIILLYPFFKPEVHCLENIPENSAFILLPKHQRWIDIPLLSAAVPRPMYYVAKHELFTNRLSNAIIHALGGLPLNRGNPIESRNALRKIPELIKAGEGLVVFPEGTYFVNKMGKGNVGIVRLILSRAHTPFIPAGIKYIKTFIGYKTIIKFGKPIYKKESDNKHSAENFLNNIMKEIADLSGL